MGSRVLAAFLDGLIQGVLQIGWLIACFFPAGFVEIPFALVYLRSLRIHAPGSRRRVSRVAQVQSGH